jgi:hypothetical protein
LPQTPQLLESAAVFTHAVPQSIWEEAQVMLPPVPPLPLPLLPPVPGLPPVEGVLQAAARIAKPSPMSHTRAVFIVTLFPGGPNLISRVPQSNAIGSAANRTNSFSKVAHSLISG